MRAVILGIGTATPAHAIAQGHAAELAKTFCCRTDEQARLVPTLYRRTHVQTRGSVLLERSQNAGLQQSFFPPAIGETDRGPTTQQRMQRYAREAAPLALRASRLALDQAQTSPRSISHLVTVSCTGFMAPGVDRALIEGLDLPATIARTHVGFMGCHGALNGLRVAASFVTADPTATVLLCAVELCSLHFHYGWDPEKVVANALFADGAGALIIHASRSPAEAWRVIDHGSCVFPDSADDMTWQIGDHGFEMRLSARIPGLIAAHLRPWLDAWLGRHGLRLQQVRSWAIHPGGPRMISAVADSLGLSEEDTAASRQTLTECGNMSSPTIVFILQRLRQQQAPRPCVALGFGPGLAVEAAVLA